MAWHGHGQSRGAGRLGWGTPKLRQCSFCRHGPLASMAGMAWADFGRQAVTDPSMTCDDMTDSFTHLSGLAQDSHLLKAQTLSAPTLADTGSSLDEFWF